MKIDIDGLIKKMTLEEKVSMCIGVGDWHTRAIPRLKIPALRMSDGPHGTRIVRDEHARDQVSQPSNCFPTGSALGSTWNTELICRVGKALGEECCFQGSSLLLGPAINIHRAPLNGRNFEYYSEDPFLTGKLASAYIKGVQSQGVGTSVKHFACNNSEYQRDSISSEVQERPFREIYLAGFEMAVKEAQPWTVMCSYNRINGAYSSENRYLLRDILKEEWGFDGFVVSDWGAVHNRVASANGGVDLEMPGTVNWAMNDLLYGIRNGSVDENLVDDKVRRILRVIELAGLFDGPLPEGDGVCNTPKNQALAREAAGEAIVLLKNENHLLPLDDDLLKTIAVIGPNAVDASFEGGGSSRVNPYYAISPLEGLQNRCNGKIEISYSRGCEITSVAPQEEDSKDPVNLSIREAVTIAAQADVAIVFVGTTGVQESESFDRKDICLSGGQVALIRRIARVNPKTIVVLNNGSVLEMKGWINEVGAVVEAWYPGQECGNAITDILFGEINPSGRLPETLPQKIEDTPSFINYPGENGKVIYGEGIFVGYRYYDKKKIEPLFPFGFGLSYTTFEYSNLNLDCSEWAVGNLGVKVDVKNTGKRAGKEVIQLYVQDIDSSLVRPVKELKGFEKVELAPEQVKTISFNLPPRAFTFYDPDLRAWVAEAGEYRILVGSSSGDIRLTAEIRLEEDFYLKV
jgi:beta-glucosidase